MARLNWGQVAKRFYLIDTFAGPVMSQFSSDEIQAGRRKLAEDQMAVGGYETDVARVRANFTEWPNAVVVPGSVPDILPAVNIPSVAFLHIDMNCAYPERAALEYFWDRLSPRTTASKTRRTQSTRSHDRSGSACSLCPLDRA